MAQMKKTKINDMFAKGGNIRADGRMVHDMYLQQVKSPEESKDAMGLLQDAYRSIPGADQAYKLPGVIEVSAEVA